MWDETTNLFPNINGEAVELWERVSIFILKILIHFQTRSFDIFFDLRLTKAWVKLEPPLIWDAIALIMMSL